MNKIYAIFKIHKYKLSLIYLFMFFTELSILTQPYLLGNAIDGLIKGSWVWVIFLGLSYLISNFFNYKQMVYDTKVYTKIYNDIVFKFLKNNKLSESTKVARTDMAYDVVHVLEGYVHYYIATIVTVVGSIFFIYAQNFNVGVLISFALLVILLSVLIFYKKIRQAIRVRNDHYENKVVSMSLGFNNSISFFNRKRRLDIYESTLQGKNWFLVGVIKSFFLLLSIILLITTSNNVTVGGVITIYSYVNNFLISLLSVPVAFEMYSRLSDIIKRLD